MTEDTCLNDYRKMNSLDGTIDELKSFGIYYLTSEACAYSMRCLFDVRTEQGKNIIESFTGMALVNDAWNSGIGSIMLLRDSIVTLIIYCLLFTGHYVIQPCSNDTYARIKYTKDQNIFYNARYYLSKKGINYKQYIQPCNPARNGRNVHAFSGRTQ